ncbi:MAG: site-specific DNA-methyltransferase [Alphaproteobacteria bacterium GM202ARS2]|nr:site-specific DNA-methyltransferase [Alphaproteobacteria bacterium GM202ARS2]
MEEQETRCLVDSIQCGDSAFLLKQMPNNSVDFVITSPPYYLQRDYNNKGIGVGHEKTVDAYIDSLLEVFSEVVRVVKPSGNIVYNIGDKYLNSSLLLVPYRFAITATSLYPVRLVNDITWVKRNPTPRQFGRRLVSSTEPFFHFSKGADYYYDRDSFPSKTKKVYQHQPSDRLGEKYRMLIQDSDLSQQAKKKAHQALDDVVREVKEGHIQGFRMKIKGIHAEAFGGQDGGRKIQMEREGFTIIRIHGKGMKKDVIESTVESIPGIKHTAVFPASVIRELIKLLCPRGGVVLDPYVGSGTTGVAAIKEGRHYIGIDIDPSYCDLSRKRIEECRINEQKKF